IVGSLAAIRSSECSTRARLVSAPDASSGSWAVAVAGITGHSVADRGRGSRSAGSADQAAAAGEVIPEHKAVQVRAGGEEDPAPGGLGEAVGEGDVLRALAPTGHQEDVDGNPLAGAQGGLAHGGGLGEGVGRVEQVEGGTLVVGRG